MPARIDPFEHYAPVPEAGCWIWLGNVGRSGYGRYKSSDRRYIPAHRLFYAKHKGDPEDQLVCHTCDTRLCVNPDHLFLGSYADNHCDMRRKGRGAKQESHGHAKLSLADVAYIRANPGRKSQAELGREFGVSQSAISLASRKLNWRDSYV